MKIQRRCVIFTLFFIAVSCAWLYTQESEEMSKKIQVTRERMEPSLRYYCLDKGKKIPDNTKECHAVAQEWLQECKKWTFLYTVGYVICPLLGMSLCIFKEKKDPKLILKLLYPISLISFGAGLREVQSCLDLRDRLNQYIKAVESTESIT